jgi:hypothetical protein
MSDKTYWKTTIVFEVLTEGETALPCDISLADIVSMTNTLNASGDVKSFDSVEVDIETMAKLLEEQRSDPEFLLGDDAKKLCPECGRLGTLEEYRDGVYLMICMHPDDCNYEDHWEWTPPKEE